MSKGENIEININDFIPEEPFFVVTREAYEAQKDKKISRNRVLMYLADLQMSTDPHTEAGQTAWKYLEMAFNGIKEMEGESDDD